MSKSWHVIDCPQSLVTVPCKSQSCTTYVDGTRHVLIGTLPQERLLSLPKLSKACSTYLTCLFKGMKLLSNAKPTRRHRALRGYTDSTLKHLKVVSLYVRSDGGWEVRTWLIGGYRGDVTCVVPWYNSQRAPLNLVTHSLWTAVCRLQEWLGKQEIWQGYSLRNITAAVSEPEWQCFDSI